MMNEKRREYYYSKVKKYEDNFLNNDVTLDMVNEWVAKGDLNEKKNQFCKEILPEITTTI